VVVLKKIQMGWKDKMKRRILIQFPRKTSCMILPVLAAIVPLLLCGCSEQSIDYYNRGAAHYSDGRYDKAISDYSRFIEINPDYADSYYRRARAYEAKGRYEQAVSDYDECIRIRPDFVQAYHRRGNAYKNMSRYDRAIADFSKAIEIAPDYAEAYFSRAIIYEVKGRDDKAIADYSKCIEIQPGDYNAYRKLRAYPNRAAAYYRMGWYDKAWKDVYKAESLDQPVRLKFIQDLRKASGRQR